MADCTVAVLGGGVGGVVAARELRRRLPRSAAIVVVDRQEMHVFQPSLLWLMAGQRRPEQFTRPLSRLKRKGIEFVQGEVTAIDPARKALRVAGREIVADYLVISPGAEYAPHAVPGLAEAGHNLFTVEGASRIRDSRAALREGRLVILVARTPFKCPAAPYEAAMLLEHGLRRRGARGRVSVDLYTPEPGPMPVTGKAVSMQVQTMLEERGVGYHPQHAVAGVDPAGKVIRFQNGATAEYDLLAYVPPHVAPAVVVSSGLANESGWVPVDRHTMETVHRNVFAIGDVTTVPLSVKLPLPKAGTFAYGQGLAVAQTIVRRVAGDSGFAAEFSGFGECFLETGGGRAAIGRGNFYAEPAPEIRLRPPSRLWHLGKVWFEKQWLRRWL